MIKSFKDKETEKIFNVIFSRKLPPQIQQRALIKLRWIHRAKDLFDLQTVPANHLEQLRGKRNGQWSIRINKQWRICFNWIENNAHNVEITDYHS